MIISQAKFIALILLWSCYAAYIIFEASLFSLGSYDYLCFFRGSLYLAVFSIILVLIPGIILRPSAIFISSVTAVLIAYYSFYNYFYNPFISPENKLYAQPTGLYEIKYPSSWKLSKNKKADNAIYIEESVVAEEDCGNWDFSHNSILIGYYSNKLAWPQGLCRGETAVEVGGQIAEARFFEDGGSTCTSVGVEITTPVTRKGKREILMIQVNRIFNSDNIPNPHAISPQRLLRKAMPLLETFRPGKSL